VSIPEHAYLTIGESYVWCLYIIYVSHVVWIMFYYLTWLYVQIETLRHVCYCKS